MSNIFISMYTSFFLYITFVNRIQEPELHLLVGSQSIVNMCNNTTK